MRQQEIGRSARCVVVFVALVGLTALVAHAKSGRVVASAAPEIAPGTKPRIEVAFVLDTTGSMSGLIEGAKQKIWALANQMASGQPRPEIRVGLVGYRDRGDQYVTRIFDLDDDIDAVYEALFAFRADGGGDTPESVNRALHDAVTRLDWSQGSDVYRVIFLVGDAPPHMDYTDDVPYAESVRLARSRDIVVNTIQCGGLAATTPVWQQIARAGAGQYVAIAQDGAMVALTTPMDEALARLNRELATTVVAYGAAEEQAELERKVARSLDAPASVAASRLSYLDKNDGRVNSGRLDLVDAVRRRLVDLASVPRELLPSEMQEMDAAAQEAFVQQKLEQRERVQHRIRELSRDRDAYLRAESARRAAEGEAHGFDDEVMDAVRDQARAKGIRYE